MSHKLEALINYYEILCYMFENEMMDKDYLRSRLNTVGQEIQNELRS